VDALFDRFHRLITSDPTRAAQNAAPELGKLTVFSGVSEFPVRVKCASLAWHTLKAALAGAAQPVSTEVSESSSGDGGGQAR
jgi:nitrogen fixation NifU-like protein